MKIKKNLIGEIEFTGNQLPVEFPTLSESLCGDEIEKLTL